jgi:hypothetical protein
MTQHRKEGLRAPLFCCLTALAVTAGANQQIEAVDLLRCSALPSAEAKLECYEALTRRVQPGTVPPATERPLPPVQQHDPLPETPAVPTGVPRMAPAPPPEDREPRPVPAPETSSVAPVAAEDDGNEDSDKDSAVRLVQVVSVARRNHVLYFEFANGETWRQMKADRITYPRNRPFEAEIRRGIMGDHQLRVEGKGRMTRIVRTQ